MASDKVFVKQSHIYLFVFISICCIIGIGLLVGLLSEKCEAGVGVRDPVVQNPSVTTTIGQSSKESEPPTQGQASTAASLPPVSGSCEPDPNVPHKPWFNVRLPTNVHPQHYSLALWPNTTTEDFKGWETITVNVTSPTRYLLIHFRPDEMEIKNTIITRDTDELEIEDETSYPCNQFHIVTMKNELDVGLYQWYMEFTGTLKGRIVGLYKSTYTTATGEERALSTSKFQPTDARRAFPNFDEPEYKATYTTTIIHDADHHAMSNMDPEETVQRSDGYLQTTFPITPRMSSYLTAYIVSDFINTNTTITNTRLNKTIPFRVWTHADQIDQTLYALDIGKRMHEYFENEWFDVEYPMLKSDMVAVPDYPSGATEHWGIITYRETNLLYDPDVSSESNKQRVAVVIGHELAHLWFGNLVTCLWWNDLWLNEGFASYLEYEGVNYVHPDWLMYDQFLTSDLFYAMEQDQIVSSHPIIQPLEHPDKINEIFDSITYSKGSSILRMLESIMGEDFRTGIKNYMNKYKFSSATTADLWNTLTDHTYFDVPRVMDTWTLQMGYPVITIKRSHDHAGKAFVRLTQTRFLIDPEAEDTTYSPYDYEWYVRFDYQSENGEYAYEWMDRSEAIFEWPSDNSTWIKANVNQTGVYRVNYDEENWIALVKQLREYHMALSAGDRAGLLNDAFNLAWAGYVNYSIALDLTRYLENEEDFVPWDTITDIFNDLSVLLYHRQAYGNWRNYIQQQVKSIYNELKFVENDDDGHLTKYLRGNILSLACGNGHADCLEAALDYFEKWKNNESVPSDFRTLVYRYGIESGDKKDWELMLQRYKDEQQANERTRLLYGLAQTQQMWLISRYLDYVWDDNIIRSQDFFTVVNYIANNPVATAVVWDWVRVNWQKMVDKFGLNYRLLGRLIPGVTNTFTTELQLQEMQHFFDMYPEAGTGARGREQALEHVQSNINWLKRYENEITSWLTINV